MCKDCFRQKFYRDVCLRNHRANCSQNQRTEEDCWKGGTVRTGPIHMAKLFQPPPGPVPEPSQHHPPATPGYVQHVGAVVRLVQKAALHDEAQDLLIGQALVRLLGQRGDLPEDNPEGPVVGGRRELWERGTEPCCPLLSSILPPRGRP